MSSMPSSEHYEILLPAKGAAEAPAFRTFGWDSEWFTWESSWSSRRSPYGKEASRHRLTWFLVVFFLGVATILAWQSYGHAARAMVANSFPQLSWLAPLPVDSQTGPDKIERISRNVDRIASDMAVTQEQMTRSIDRLAADQEQMTRELIRLQALSQYGPHKDQAPPPQSAPGPTHKGVQRASQTH